ncbi:TPA: hypothetical protein DF272_04275 [Candidatus Falkowbacteria bacterium]|nr:hypothetical protein [Candidatus Falkowbacteria bacterium]
MCWGRRRTSPGRLLEGGYGGADPGSSFDGELFELIFGLLEPIFGQSNRIVAVRRPDIYDRMGEDQLDFPGWRSVQQAVVVDDAVGADSVDDPRLRVDQLIEHPSDLDGDLVNASPFDVGRQVPDAITDGEHGPGRFEQAQARHGWSPVIFG